MTTGIKERFAEHVKSLQNQITDEIKRIDESVEIKQDLWKRNDHIGADGGGGITRAFKGKIFEK